MELAESLHQIIPDFPEGKCRDIDPDFMFPDTDIQLAERLPKIRATCQSCVHMFECRNYALDKRIPDGVWGGMTEGERRSILRKEGVGEREGVVYVNSEDRLEEVLKLMAQGHTRTAISKRLGIDFIQVDRVVQLARKRGLI